MFGLPNSPYGATHLLLQVMVGRDNHTNIHARGFGAANAFHLTLFEHAKKLRLHHGRHVANLIQKQSSAVSLLELADVPRAFTVVVLNR